MENPTKVEFSILENQRWLNFQFGKTTLVDIPKIKHQPLNLFSKMDRLSPLHPFLLISPGAIIEVSTILSAGYYSLLHGTGLEILGDGEPPPRGFAGPHR